MENAPLYLAITALAAVVALVGTEAVRRVAVAFNLADAPNERRINTTLMPRAGGFAVVLSFFLVGATVTILAAPLGVTGKEATAALEAVGVTINKNSIPGETRSPMVTSGVRYGTPAATTRGMGLAEMEQIAQWSVEAIAARDDAAKLEQIRREVVKVARQFPVPGNDAAELAARES